MHHLTDRQRQVAALVAEGKREAEIAVELDISIHTVKVHKQAIYAKLGARNAVELANIIHGDDIPNLVA